MIKNELFDPTQPPHPPKTPNNPPIGVLAAINFTFQKFKILLKLLKGKDYQGISSTEDLKHNLYISFISTIIANYDLFFFIFNTMSVNSILCRWSVFQQSIGTQSGENYLDISFTDVISNENVANKTLVVRRVYTAHISQNIECMSSEHFSIIIFGIALFLLNLQLRVHCSKLMRFSPSTTILGCKYGNWDLSFDALIFIMLLLKSVSVTYLNENYQLIRVIYFFYLVLLLLAYVINFHARPYYNRRYSQLRNFQIIYLLTLSTVSVVVREVKLNWMRTELSTICVILICMSIITKINENLNRENISEIASEMLDLRLASVHTILRVYYRVVVLIDHHIQRSKDGKGLPSARKTDLNNTAILVNFLVKSHQKACRNPHCMCQSQGFSDSEPFKKNHFLINFPKSFEGEKMVIKSLFILNNIFDITYYREKKKDKALFRAYVDFLINYLGNATLANMVIRRKIEEDRISRRNKYTVERLGIDFQVLLDQLNTLSLKNQKKADLAMTKNIVYEDSTKASGVSAGPADGLAIQHFLEYRSVRIGDISHYINFLKRFEAMKELIRQATVTKESFLTYLAANKDSRLQELFKKSKKFFQLKTKIKTDFEILKEISKVRYLPIFQVYGSFISQICEDEKQGENMLRVINKILGRSNLNEVFLGEWKSALRSEFAAIYVNNEHSITYCTSNLKTWVGYDVSELVKKDLSVLIPEPARSFHHKFFDTRHFSRGGGSKLMEEYSSSVLVKTKSGNLVPVELNLRLNSGISSGNYEYVGVLNFSGKRKDVCVLILDGRNRIRGMSGQAEELFSVGERLEKYNAEFKRVCEVSENLHFLDFFTESAFFLGFFRLF